VQLRVRGPGHLALALLLSITAGCGARSDLSVPGPAGVKPRPASGCVLFGGFPDFSSVALDDTWTWDGEAWSDAHASPGMVEGVAATLDGQAVLFASADSSGATTVTPWVWSGSAWAPQSPPSSPPARGAAAVAAFPGGVLLFGGFTLDGSQTLLADTWIWDGTAWSSPSSPTAPSPRGWASAASLDGGVILFGGADHTTGALNDTWIWDGATWAEMTSPSSPSPRIGAATASVGGSVVLFGGCVGGSADGCEFGGQDAADTWQWAGAEWAQLTPTVAPPRRDTAMLATFGARALLFGGFVGDSNGTGLADTWAWDGSTWDALEVPGPPGRGAAAMSCW
jgi:hypothetical protein